MEPDTVPEHVGILTDAETLELELMVSDITHARRTLHAHELSLTTRAREILVARGLEPDGHEIDTDSRVIRRTTVQG